MDKFWNSFAVHNPKKHINKDDSNHSYGGGGHSNSGRPTEVIYSREHSDNSKKRSSVSSMSENEKAELLKKLPATVDWSKMTKQEWQKIGEVLPEDTTKMKNAPNNRVNV
ncbi:hypothetical protein QEN19_002811 [Hanseniaspora menglaensis]